MKKIYLILFAVLVVASAKSVTILIVPNAGPPGPTSQWNITYTTVAIGDVVTFGVSNTYPVTEVDQANWNANGTTSLSTGFGTKVNSYTFTITALTTNTIYFVCPPYVGNATPMKGRIVKAGTTGLSAINNQLTQISLFPNPANSEVNISLPSNLSDVTLKLIGVNGQEITLTSNNQISATTSNSILTAILPSSIGNGVYFIEVSTANERIYKKL